MQEIPDSDPTAPVLNPDEPLWIQLPFTVEHDPPTAEPSNASKRRRKSSNYEDAVEFSEVVEDEVVPASTEDSQPVTANLNNAQPMEPINKVLDTSNNSNQEVRSTGTERGENPANSEHALPNPEITQSGNTNDFGGSETSQLYYRHSRRKRFNFEEWVENEKKVHEMVYHKRYEVFHGAKSDSEDDDYGEFEDTNVDTNVETYADREIDKDIDRDVDLESIGKSNDTGNEHRRRIIDSDFSDSDSSLSVLKPKRKITKSIPASKRVNTDISPDSLPEMMPDSLPERLPDSVPDFLLPRHAPDRMADDDIEEGAPSFDFMMARPRQKASVVDLAHQLGDQASTIIRIAARTAKRTARRPTERRPTERKSTERKSAERRPAGRNGTIRVDNALPADRKESSTRVSTTASTASANARSTRSARSRPARSTLGDSFQKKFFHGDNQHEAVRVIRKLRNPPSSVLEASSSVHKASKKTSKPRDQGVTVYKSSQRLIPRQNVFHTPVLERDIGPKMAPLVAEVRGYTRSGVPTTNTPGVPGGRPRVPGGRYGPNPGDSGGSGVPGSPTTMKVKVDINEPNCMINLSQLTNSTFIGSKILDILETPDVLICKPLMKDKFGTHLSKASSYTVEYDSQKILQICTGFIGDIDAELYNKIYDYLLLNTAYLVDESEIVSIDFKVHVLKLWQKTAKQAIKHILKAKNVQNFLVYTTQALCLATLLVSVRVANFDGKNMTNIHKLCCWALYYTQTSISHQIDSAKHEREIPGAELCYAAYKLNVYKQLPVVFARGQTESNLHLLCVITAINHEFSNWDLVNNQLMNNQLMGNISVSMKYSLLLLLKWNWPPNTEVIKLIFNHYKQQKYYADPRGESIALPDYLWKTEFDGKVLPKQEFSLFLELLGVTLLKFKALNDLSTCLSLAGSVTPLNVLVFPETSELTTANLSSASHQYAILLLLIRLMEKRFRPPVCQLRDQVVLLGGHLAIRMMAVSAWGMALRFSDQDEFVDLKEWMDLEILQNEPPESLVDLVVKECISLGSSTRGYTTGHIADKFEAVPVSKILNHALQSSSKSLRKNTFKLLKLLPLKFFTELPHILPTDLESFTDLVLTNQKALEYWPYEETKPVLVAELLNENKVLRSDFEVLSQLLKSLLNPQWTTYDYQLFNVWHPNENVERINWIKQVFQRYKSIELARQTLAIVKQHYFQNKFISYRSVVAEVRQMVFEQFPELLKTNKWLNEKDLVKIESFRNIILELLRNDKASEYECECFLSYKLRSSLELDSGKSFIFELCKSMNLSFTNQSTLAFDLVVNKLFAKYVVESVRDGEWHSVVKILIKSVCVLLQHSLALHFDPSVFINACVYYCNSKIRSEMMFTNSGFRLLTELFKLCYLYLIQCLTTDCPRNWENMIYDVYTLGYRIKRIVKYSDMWPIIERPLVPEVCESYDFEAMKTAFAGFTLDKPVHSHGVEPHGVEPHGVEPHGVEPHGDSRDHRALDDIDINGVCKLACGYEKMYSFQRDDKPVLNYTPEGKSWIKPPFNYKNMFKQL